MSPRHLPRLLRDALLAAVALVWVLGGAALGVLLLHATGGPATTHRIARRRWAPFLLRVAGARLEVVGHEHVDLSRPHLFALNHRSLLDIPVTMIALPCELHFVAKESLLRVPLLGRYLRAMGMVVIPRRRRVEAVGRLRDAAELLAAGHQLVTFPEGTRSPPGEVAPFKTGSFLPALETGVPVVPVAVAGSGHVLPRGRLRRQPGTIRVEIGEPVPTEGLGLGERRWLAGEVRGRVVAMLRESERGGPRAASVRDER